MLNLAFAGPICSGKTTIADTFVDLFGYRRLSFAGALKSEVAIRHGITVDALNADKAAYREELRSHGAAMRAIDPLHWCTTLGRVYDMERYAGRPFIVDDLRYHNEVDYLRQKGFVIVAVHTSEIIRRRRHFDRYGVDMPGDDEGEQQSRVLVPDLRISGIDRPTNAAAEIIRWYGRQADVRS